MVDSSITLKRTNYLKETKYTMAHLCNLYLETPDRVSPISHSCTADGHHLRVDIDHILAVYMVNYP